MTLYLHQVPEDFQKPSSIEVEELASVSKAKELDPALAERQKLKR